MFDNFRDALKTLRISPLKVYSAYELELLVVIRANLTLEEFVLNQYMRQRLIRLLHRSRIFTPPVDHTDIVLFLFDDNHKAIKFRFPINVINLPGVTSDHQWPFRVSSAINKDFSEIVIEIDVDFDTLDTSLPMVVKKLSEKVSGDVGDHIWKFLHSNYIKHRLCNEEVI